MASWLEQLGGDLSEATSTIIGAGAGKLASKLEGDKTPPADRPERQYDTEIAQPTNGPASQVKNPASEFAEAFNQYKWWAAGALALVAFMAIKGAR